MRVEAGAEEPGEVEVLHGCQKGLGGRGHGLVRGPDSSKAGPPGMMKGRARSEPGEWTTLMVDETNNRDL